MRPVSSQVRRRLYILYILGIAAYAVITLTAPVMANQYNLSKSAVQLLDLTILLPVALIYLAGFYGAANFKAYSVTIKDSPDGRALEQVSNGLLVIIVGGLLQSLVIGLRSRMILAGHIIGFTHFTNLIGVIIPLVGYFLMYQGSVELVRLSKGGEPHTLRSNAFLVIPFSLLSTFYTWAVLANPFRNFSADVTKYASYFWPDLLVMTLAVAPTVAWWLLGALTIINVRNYHKTAKGVLYRGALSGLANGLFAVVIFAISLQFLGAIGPGLNLQNASLKVILSLVYVILLLYGLSYLLIALGARRLTRIEEIE